MSKKINIVVALVLCVFLLACKQKKASMRQLSSTDLQKTLVAYNKRLNEQVEKEMQQYTNASGLNYTKTPTGLYYVILEQGTPDSIYTDNTVLANFEYFTLDGELASSVGLRKNVSFVAGKHQLAAVNEAMFYSTKGSKISLVIPPYLGFGLNGDGYKIPPARPFMLQMFIQQVN